MEGLAKLRPFVRFCQIVGSFPFRMEMDLQSGKLKRFTFSFCHPVTWWYIMIQSLGWINLVFWFCNESEHQGVVEFVQKQDSRFRISYAISLILGIIYFFYSRFIVYPLFCFGKTIELAMKVDKNLECLPKKSVYKDSITLRIYTGLVISLSLVKFMDYLV